MFLQTTYRLQLSACVISLLISTMVCVHVFSSYLSLAWFCFLNAYSKYFFTVYSNYQFHSIYLLFFKNTLNSLYYFCTLLFSPHLCHYLSPRIIKVIYFLYIIFMHFQPLYVVCLLACFWYNKCVNPDSHLLKNCIFLEKFNIHIFFDSKL